MSTESHTLVSDSANCGSVTCNYKNSDSDPSSHEWTTPAVHAHFFSCFLKPCHSTHWLILCLNFRLSIFVLFVPFLFPSFCFSSPLRKSLAVFHNFHPPFLHSSLFDIFWNFVENVVSLAMKHRPILSVHGPSCDAHAVKRSLWLPLSLWSLHVMQSPDLLHNAGHKLEDRI